MRVRGLFKAVAVAVQPLTGRALDHRVGAREASEDRIVFALTHMDQEHLIVVLVAGVAAVDRRRRNAGCVLPVRLTPQAKGIEGEPLEGVAARIADQIDRPQGVGVDVVGVGGGAVVAFRVGRDQRCPGVEVVRVLDQRSRGLVLEEAADVHRRPDERDHYKWATI